MIQQALQYTTNTFNQFVKNQFELDDTPVITNTIIAPDGSIPLENKNKIVISLIHIAQETTKQFYNKSPQIVNGKYVHKRPTECYNLYLLVTANFDNYQEALKFINVSVKFFQTYALIDANRNSNIPKGLSKIEFDLEKENNYMQMQNLWTALGAKYQPSLIYKMRLITISSDEVHQFDSPISHLSNNTQVI